MEINFDVNKIETPAYVVDGALLEKNLKILDRVQKESGAKILLAQKAFSMFYFYPLIKKYLAGSAASSYHEAKLGYEEMGGETHIFSPAYKDSEFDNILSVCDHLVFNSYHQWETFRERVINAKKSAGIRVNPGYSEIEKEIYNPCAPLSRLGVTAEEFSLHDLNGIEGIHFHSLCEQNADALERTVPHFEKRFGHILKNMKWLNMGGGHHITREDYDLDKLIEIIKYFKEKYGVTVYLEPGEAIALNAGFLVAEVVDIVENGGSIAVLDASAACHMPDVIEMPYRPRITGAGEIGKFPYLYRLGGPSCLSGDIVGDYSFPAPLKRGGKLVFEDMAIYSMVKNNTFNGINLPSIYAFDDGKLIKIKSFGYNDFKKRLS